MVPSFFRAQTQSAPPKARGKSGTITWAQHGLVFDFSGLQPPKITLTLDGLSGTKKNLKVLLSNYSAIKVEAEYIEKAC